MSDLQAIYFNDNIEYILYNLIIIIKQNVSQDC